MILDNVNKSVKREKAKQNKTLAFDHIWMEQGSIQETQFYLCIKKVANFGASPLPTNLRVLMTQVTNSALVIL